MERWSLPVVLSATLLLATSVAAAAPRDLIEGSYELIEWTDGDLTLKPPAISGRYVIRDGMVTWVVHKFHEGRQLTHANLGSYQFTATTFNYGYGNWFSMSGDAQPTKVVREAPAPFADMVLPRMREFMLTEEGGVVKASYRSARFEFTRDGVTYTDEITRAVRKYRRIAAD